MTKFINFLFFYIPLLFVDSSKGEVYYDWTVSLSQQKPLGVEKKVIVINDQFPGPLLKATTNDVVNINIHNNISEPFLMTWNGLHMRKNSWQDGVQETNCPIQPAQNWTYSFQLKDQIGSYFYFPSLFFQKAAGGYGPIRVQNRDVIPLPFSQPDHEFDLLIGDWYNSDYQRLRATLDEGRMLPLPDGILINGLGPNQTSFDFEPGATYRLRISNVGLKTTINLRIQDHPMLLIETEGTHTLKQYYDSLDIHVGQSYSVLVTALNHFNAASFFMVAAARFIPHELVGIAFIRYSGFEGHPLDPMLPPLQPPPFDYEYSFYQALSIRMLFLKNDESFINREHRYTVNGVSFVHPDTPLKLAHYFNISGVFESRLFPDTPLLTPPRLGVSVIETKYRDYVHIVFQNTRLSPQTWHADGYNFFVVGMGSGVWDEGKTSTYNMVDAIYRSTVQVYPLCWTAILIKLDNMGMWNLRSQDAEKWYKGQELYIKVNGEEDPFKISLRDENPIPQNLIKCGRAISFF
ncbi:SKU5 similar 18 [Perilla frutescens var. hirtella]|uniref:SKU5 similar 18 n=1 Tax=Perilla frutescens var. hirtella TaxID=608512 RepID=A0AAD4IS17_PERFH|nr:SKU5 similar 18 [Perilla frutescens var. hirtella]